MSFLSFIRLQMKKSIIPILLSAISSFSYSGDLEDGDVALNKKDYVTAFQKFKNSAEQGFPFANIRLGNMYDAGLGVKQNLKEAMRYYKIAAQQGHPLGFVFVGAMYENGQGVEQDLKEAERWKHLLNQCALQNWKNCGNIN